MQIKLVYQRGVYAVSWQSTLVVDSDVKKMILEWLETPRYSNIMLCIRSTPLLGIGIKEPSSNEEFKKTKIFFSVVSISFRFRVYSSSWSAWQNLFRNVIGASYYHIINKTTFM